MLVSIYTIPCVAVFLKTLVFYFRNQQRIKTSRLRIEMFQSFLLMQTWSMTMKVGEFLVIKIPATGLPTRFFASENPQMGIQISMMIFYLGFYNGQAFTVMFCLLRVAILCWKTNLTNRKFLIWLTPIISSFGFLLALPHFLSGGLCIQLYEPFPLGSTVLASYFQYGHPVVSLLNFTFSATSTFLIVSSNVVLFLKIRKQRTLPSSQNSKAEKILTGTMIILLIPQVLYLLVETGEILQVSFYSYLLLYSGYILDLRVHLVTCYFYFTHPVFKKSETKLSSSVMQKHSVIG